MATRFARGHFGMIRSQLNFGVRWRTGLLAHHGGIMPTTPPRRTSFGVLQLAVVLATTAAVWVHLWIGEGENAGSRLRPIGHGSVLVGYAWLLVVLVSSRAILRKFAVWNFGWIGLTLAVAAFWLMLSV